MSPAPRSRISVCMYTPERKSAMRFLAFFFVVLRLSGAPRSQFFTRCENSHAPDKKRIGRIV